MSTSNVVLNFSAVAILQPLLKRITHVINFYSGKRSASELVWEWHSGSGMVWCHLSSLHLLHLFVLHKHHISRENSLWTTSKWKSPEIKNVSLVSSVGDASNRTHAHLRRPVYCVFIPFLWRYERDVCVCCCCAVAQQWVKVSMCSQTQTNIATLFRFLICWIPAFESCRQNENRAPTHCKWKCFAFLLCNHVFGDDIERNEAQTNTRQIDRKDIFLQLQSYWVKFTRLLLLNTNHNHKTEKNMMVCSVNLAQHVWIAFQHERWTPAHEQHNVQITQADCLSQALTKCNSL